MIKTTNKMNKGQMLDMIISICLDATISDKNKVLELREFALNEKGLSATLETLKDNTRRMDR